MDDTTNACWTLVVVLLIAAAMCFLLAWSEKPKKDDGD